MNPFYKAYTDYFESIAAKHKDILHVIGDKDNCHFTAISIHDFQAGIVSKIKFPHLLLLKPECTFINEKSENILKNYLCMFMVLDKFSPTETTPEQSIALFNKCEALGDEIIARMIDDRELGEEEGRSAFPKLAPFYNVSGTPVGDSKENNLYHGSKGWLITFEMLWPLDQLPDNTKWTDL